MSHSSKVKRNRLSGRDRKIVEHIARYRLTTIEVLRHTILAGMSQNAVRKVLTRLCRAGYLHNYTLQHPAQYFVLGDVGANALGLASHRTVPLGPQSLPIDYSVLVYATLGKQPRQRLTRAEVLALCPWLPPKLAAAPHCRDQAHEVLELIRVDLGGPASHVARKCVTDLNERRQIREFGSFVAQGRFRLAVITATKEKAATLRLALDRHDWPAGLLIHFSVVSDLLSLTARHDHA